MKKIILVSLCLLALIPTVGFSQDRNQDQIDHEFICRLLQEKSGQNLMPIYTALTVDQFEKQVEDDNSVKGGYTKEVEDTAKSYQIHLNTVASSNSTAKAVNAEILQAQAVHNKFCTTLSEHIVHDTMIKGLQPDQ